MLTLCVLGYAGFFRFNELVQLRRCDFQFEDSFMRIFVHRSKTDVYRDGAWVVIAKTFKHTCPYLLVQRYFVRYFFVSRHFSPSCFPSRCRSLENARVYSFVLY